MSNFNPSALAEFARYYGFHYDQIDPAEMVLEVLSEMEKGLEGKPSSLAMIPAYISPKTLKIKDRTVIALDAGGTNLRTALVKFDESGKAIIQGSREVPMPGTQGRLSREAFFDEIAAVTAPLIEEADSGIEGIGVCFSYPMEITKEADGIPLAFSKELDLPEVLGKAIGSNLRDALTKRKVQVPEKIVLLNDTAATLLTGLTQLPCYGSSYGTDAGPVAGFILGTGFNTAYPEKSIPKIDFYSPDHPQIVVCESGNFAHRYMGLLDREFDSTTKNPGSFTLEKAVSGAYIGPLTFTILRRAIKDGILSFKKADELLSSSGLGTRKLNEFLNDPLARKGSVGGLFDYDELDALKSFVYLTSIVTERGALLSAVVLAALVEKMSFNDPIKPVRIAVEGSTFVLYKGMRKALESHLHTLLNKKKPLSYTIAAVEKASLLGAAVAALS